MLGIEYTTAIDMWSFGCIIYELYVGMPLVAGESEQQQLQGVMEIFGAPPTSLVQRGN